MSETLLANLFFIITGSAMLVVAAFLCIVLYHAYKAVKLAREILDRVQKSTELLVEDVQTFRRQILHGGIVKQVFGMIFSAISHAAPKRRSTRRRKVTSEEE